MKYLVSFIIVFLIIYLLYLLFVILRKKKLNTFKDNTYVNYLVKVYKLDKEKLDNMKLAHIIALSNAFIIATTYVIIINVKNLILMLLLAFVVLIPIQLFVYHIIGKTLKKGEKKKCIIMKK